MYLSRNRKLILGAFATALLACGIWQLSIPDQYEASVLMRVQPSRLPDFYAHSPIVAGISSQISDLKDQITSATRLKRVIDQLGLYKSLRGHKTEEEIIERMRTDIRLEVVRNSDGLSDDRVRTFRISYRGEDPRLVARVCNQLATVFIDESFMQRQMQAMSTKEFIENQLRHAKKALEEAEESVSPAKSKGERAVAALDLSVLHDNYVSLLKKKLEADTAIDVERMQKGERLEVVDIAMPPKEPIKRSNFLAAAW